MFWPEPQGMLAVAWCQVLCSVSILCSTHKGHQQSLWKQLEIVVRLAKSKNNCLVLFSDVTSDVWLLRADAKPKNALLNGFLGGGPPFDIWAANEQAFFDCFGGIL